MSATDTPPHVRERLSTIFASMSGAEKVELAMKMAAEAKMVSLAGIRSRHPDWDDGQVAREWLRLLHGDDVADRGGSVPTSTTRWAPFAGETCAR